MARLSLLKGGQPWLPCNTRSMARWAAAGYAHESLAAQAKFIPSELPLGTSRYMLALSENCPDLETSVMPATHTPPL